MKAVHYGAGNIGRGFIGLLLHQSGYEVVFADVVPTLIETLNQQKSYRVMTLGQTQTTEQVTGIRAVNLASETCYAELIGANLVTTAVGIRNLPAVADSIIAGLRLRKEHGVETPLNILACENALQATDILKQYILERVSPDLQTYIETHVGFANVAVDRIAPNVKMAVTEPLDSFVEDFFEWDIEKSGLLGSVSIHGATFVDKLDPYLERKLFLLNGIHAIVAYLGYQKGYDTIDQAIQDAQILRIASGVQAEASRGLVFRHLELGLEGLTQYSKLILDRFRNAYLVDQVTRVGRDPLRKLGPADRLITPLHRCLEAGVTPQHLLLGIAAAFRYDAADDHEAVELQAMISVQGIEDTIRQVSRLTDDSLITAIAEKYRQF